MTQSNEENARFNRNRQRQSDRLANWLIGAVVIGLFIAGWIVLSPDKQVQPDEETRNEQEEQALTKEDPEADTEADSEQGGIIETDEADEVENLPSDTIEIIENSTDEFVLESYVDPAWKPIGTSQSGEHVSLYDGTSVDWKEKEQALLYATGLTEENAIFWKIKNGGGPQQSIGIISSKNQVEKYRVHLMWVAGEGWKPVQVDVLETLEFDF